MSGQHGVEVNMRLPPSTGPHRFHFRVGVVVVDDFFSCPSDGFAFIDATIIGPFNIYCDQFLCAERTMFSAVICTFRWFLPISFCATVSDYFRMESHQNLHHVRT